jgi:DNA-binding NarL/FixJ family response regulator
VHSDAASRAAARGGSPLTVVVIDRQQMIRSALRQALSAAGLLVVAEADNNCAGVRAVARTRPDVVLIDVALPERGGIEAIEEIRIVAPDSRVLALTVTAAQERLADAIVAGACGAVHREDEAEAIVEAVQVSAEGGCVVSPRIAGELLASIRDRASRLAAASQDAAQAIRSTLTGRELEIFQRLASGESNQEIGRALLLSENTVKNHVASILAKLGLSNRIQAAAQAVRSGFSAFASGFLLQAVLDESAMTNAVLTFLFGG